MTRLKVVFVVLAAFVVSFFAFASFSEASVNCELCHGELMKKKRIHAAVKMGCAVCHTGIDAQDVPHKTTSSIPRGLSANQPDLCYPCHKKNNFTGMKQVHPPVLGGMCTTCHNPHGSENEKLLTDDLPDLCFNCHDKTKFEGEAVHQPAKIGLCMNCHAPHQSNTAKLLNKEVPGICYQCHQKDEYTRKNIHMPVAGGCAACHSAHAAGNDYLLNRRPVFVCLECHADVQKRPHVLASKQGHPVGLSKKKKQDKSTAKKETDAGKKEKDFYCGNCHNPHSSDWSNLYRYEAQRPFDLCKHCHKKE